ncbi:Monoglycylase TTLL3 [Oopsacas minuta]|uniref:Monoglycylase TTLL3 n=1 Tax=Oopsacas minuta TaxID=111878 RepID=A0AAV7JZD8_9METZ|nr:Monoglycylase TTLL3 [Oopsacas minuta]
MLMQESYESKPIRFTLPLTTHKKLLQTPAIKQTLISIDTYDNPTFFSYTPKISVKSRKLASKLSTTFQERQQLHLVRRDKFFETEQESILIHSRSIEKSVRPESLFSKVIPFTRSLTSLQKQTKINKKQTPTPQQPEPEVTNSPTHVKKERPQSLHLNSHKDSKRLNRPSTDKVRILKSFYQSKSTDKNIVLKTRANRAVNNKNIFKVKGPYNIMRRQLRKRGWLEQDYESKHSKDRTKTNLKTDNDTDSSGSDYESSSDCPSDEDDYCAVTRIIRNALPNFIITLKSGDTESKFLTKSQFANHFRRTGSFTTKSGLTQTIQDLAWYSDSNPVDFFPRCFLLSSADDQPVFIQDYLKTAAISILKDLKNSIDNGTFKSMENSSSQITNSTVKFAFSVCNEILKSIQHDDVDDISAVTSYDENSPQWKTLLESSYRLKAQQITWENACKNLHQEITALLTSLRDVMPQFNMDGSCNIWIVKPGAMSRGRGIKCLSRLDAILEIVSARVLLKEGKYVVQKYIENPLLIEGTKFDIRQWFLVTDWAPLTVWMYRECYVRFSGQPFSLENFHESIHLCNNSIQKNYSVSISRSSKLPTDNICDLEEFSQYLINITGSDIWNESLFEKAKKILFSLMLSSSPNIESHKGSFELYGADFMISDDLQLYLLEINSSPTMARNTQVTKRLCKQVQEDTIRFVIDSQKSKQQAESCNWVFAGKGPKVNLQSPPYGVCHDMMVLGKQIKPHRFC